VTKQADCHIALCGGGGFGGGAVARFTPRDERSAD
jgi:hypothetical protein